MSYRLWSNYRLNIGWKDENRIRMGERMRDRKAIRLHMYNLCLWGGGCKARKILCCLKANWKG